MPLFSNDVRKRVMKAIDAKIEAVQKKFETELSELEKEHEMEKTNLLDTHVESITSKFI